MQLKKNCCTDDMIYNYINLSIRVWNILRFCEDFSYIVKKGHLQIEFVTNSRQTNFFFPT